jgi:hypothetical protein
MTTTETPETLEDWLKCHRISNISVILGALNDLGATELRDLFDLEEDDVSKFQPPFMKKLEFIRFSRGIESLQESAAASQRNVAKAHVPQKVPEIETMSSEGQFLTSFNNEDDNNEDEGSFPRPPLPSRCPSIGCAGVLSSHLGSRKTKYLMKIPGAPDRRWTATCSVCSKKWHCCHFLCGKILKVSSLGTSEIIRHEHGRLNRWQRKIQPPCSRNPRYNSVRAGYEEEMTRLQQANHSKNKLPETDDVLVESSSGTHGPSSESKSSPVQTDAFDDELKSILGPIDDEAWEMNMVLFDSTTPNDSHHSKADINIPKEMTVLPAATKKAKTDVDSSTAIIECDIDIPKEMNVSPANKKVKTDVDSSTALIYKEMDELSDKLLRGCIVRKFFSKNCSKLSANDAALVKSSCGTHGTSSESIPCPIETDAFDDELKSILDPIDDDARETDMVDQLVRECRLRSFLSKSF